MGGFGIDFGTANTVVCHPRRGVVLQAPSVMVVRENPRARRMAPLMVGEQARAVIGRCPVGLATVHPIRDGVIVDLEAARAYLAAVRVQVREHAWRRPRAVLAVSAGATPLERRGLLEAADEAGWRRPRLVPDAIAGAVGCGLDPMEPRTHLILDLGAGAAAVTAVCFGGVLASRACRVAGNELDLALQQYLRTEHQLIVGEVAAEDAKCRVGTDPEPSLVVHGLDAPTGRPRLVTLGAGEVVEALRTTVDGMLATLASCFDELPPQAIDDILQDGVWLIGGGALLRGVDKVLEDMFGFPIRQVERPQTAVAEGAATCLQLPDVLAAFDGERGELT